MRPTPKPALPRLLHSVVTLAILLALAVVFHYLETPRPTSNGFYTLWGMVAGYQAAVVYVRWTVWRYG